MSYDINNMCNVTYFNIPEKITLVDGHSTKCNDIGTLYVLAKGSNSSRNLDKPIAFKNSLIVPSFSCHLFSVRKITESSHSTVEFGNNMVTIWYNK